MEKKDVRRLLLILLISMLLVFSSGIQAEEYPEDYSADEKYKDYEEYAEEEADSGVWYSVLVSEPDGNGGGNPVTLEYDAELELPGNGEYSWYTCDESGQKGDFLAVTTENRYITEAFDRPEIRYYLCEMSANGQRYENELFVAGLTGLPLIRIHTEDEEEIAYLDHYLSGTIVIQDGETILEQPISVKGRGNATFDYAKKPYTIKLEKKTRLLDMEKAKKWALLPGYCDKTLLRAAMGFRVSELVGLAYTPTYRYVDLVVNGQYLGNYLLTETVKEEAKRLNMGMDGYIVEETQYETDDPEFYTGKNLRFRFRYPDKDTITNNILNTVSAEINQLEKEILELDGEDAVLPENLDLESWANWLLVQNILDNKDTNRYYYKTRSGAKICMGPVWDFEWSVGIGWYDGERPNPSHQLVVKTEYFRKLIGNRQFLQHLKERWREISSGLEEALITFMDDTIRKIDLSQKLNFCRWRILDRKISVGGIPLGTYEAEVECDKAYLREHIRWLDEQISGL